MSAVDYVETKEEIADLPTLKADFDEENFDDEFDFSEYFEDDDDYYEEDYDEEEDEEEQLERERYAQHL